MPDVFDFPRDIQPILDKHCVECHSPRRQSLRGETLGPRSENGPPMDRNQCVLPRHVRVAGLWALPRPSAVRSHDATLRELPRS